MRRRILPLLLCTCCDLLRVHDPCAVSNTFVLQLEEDRIVTSNADVHGEYITGGAPQEYTVVNGYPVDMRVVVEVEDSTGVRLLDDRLMGPADAVGYSFSPRFYDRPSDYILSVRFTPVLCGAF